MVGGHDTSSYCERSTSTFLRSPAKRSASGRPQQAQVQRPRVVRHGRDALNDLDIREPVVDPQPPLHIIPNLAACASCRDTVASLSPVGLADLHQGQLLRIVTAKAKPVARRARPSRPSTPASRRQTSRARAWAVDRHAGALFLQQRLEPSCFAITIDVSLREQAQPRGEAAAAMEIPEQRLSKLTVNHIL